MVRKTTVLKEKKFDNIFNKHFDRPTIAYSIVDTVTLYFFGINFVISKAACNLTGTKLYQGKFFQSSIISLQDCCQPRDK